MEISVCFRTSISDCSWMGVFHFLLNFHQWDSLHCNQAYRSNKLCHRFLFPRDKLYAIALSYVLTCNMISCQHTGIDAYVIAFTALAAGTSWPDLMASKIAAERMITADSAIANITCRYF